MTVVKSIFLGQKKCFGNQLIMIYKTTFYCQILGCKKIILDKKYNWFLKNKIINKKYKMIIEIDNIININKYHTIIDKTSNFFYYSQYLNPSLRIDLFRGEIMKNLLKITINNKDLFIYIRSGDIFINPHPYYSQPPLCFYKKVLGYFSFNNIYLIAVNKNNPVINEILINYPNIIYNFNSLKIDISYLVNAYNIVGGGLSTFFSNILELNKNIHILWFFKFKSYRYNQNQKFKIKIFYNIYQLQRFILYSSKKYLKKMNPWKNTKEQRDLMISDNCPN